MVQTRNLSQYRELHAQRANKVHSGSRHCIVEPYVRWLKPRSILDYGCGRSTLVDDLRISTLATRDRFDPAIPAISTIPKERYDVIISTDVLEHLDENEIEPVLLEISAHGDAALLCVYTQPARSVLPNGENAHATVRPANWWLEKTRGIFPQAELFRFNQRVVSISTIPVPASVRALSRVREYAIRMGL